MNPLRPPSSSSKQGRAAPAAHAVRSDSGPGDAVARAPTARTDGSTTAVGNLASLAAAAASPPPFPNLQAAGIPAWWTSSSPMGSNEGIYPQGGFTNFLESNSNPENFHLVGNTRASTTISPNAPSLKRTRPVDNSAHDKETIVVDADETNEDERTDRRLNYTKEEDVRLASAWLKHSWSTCVN